MNPKVPKRGPPFITPVYHKTRT